MRRKKFLIWNKLRRIHSEADKGICSLQGSLMEHGSATFRADTSSWSTVKCPHLHVRGVWDHMMDVFFAASAHVEQEALAWAPSLHVPF